MQVFLVGGAVRDRLLGRSGGDRDWVVVGATVDEMLAAGYRAVGKDFPVFLHPRTQEEYALARTERKSGHGYRGFVVQASPDVTLEQDLERRDFSINAIAQREDGSLVDPFGGVRDLQARLLRHVGPAFAEDPVRILRAARFMARFAPLGFRIADETRALMRGMVEAGEVDHLVPERVWQELQRALREPRPSAFLATLRDCGALARILPEVDALYGVPQRAEYHPEIDAGVHTGMVMDMAAKLAPGDDLIGFCALTHDLGKALTPDDVLPRHLMHEHNGLRPLRELAERLRVPREHFVQAQIVCREHLNVHRIDELKSVTVHDLIARCDGFRKPARIERLGLACECDKRGRLGMEEESYPQRATLDRLHAAACAVNARDLGLEGLTGQQIAERLRKGRIAAIEAAR
jgi:tRNA nucleotidyltransferase (CCA-adding enzyme)